MQNSSMVINAKKAVFIFLLVLKEHFFLILSLQCELTDDYQKAVYFFGDSLKEQAPINKQFRSTQKCQHLFSLSVECVT